MFSRPARPEPRQPAAHSSRRYRAAAVNLDDASARAARPGRPAIPGRAEDFLYTAT